MLNDTGEDGGRLRKAILCLSHLLDLQIMLGQLVCLLFERKLEAAIHGTDRNQGQNHAADLTGIDRPIEPDSLFSLLVHVDKSLSAPRHEAAR